LKRPKAIIEERDRRGKRGERGERGERNVRENTSWAMADMEMLRG
jgi:hypothetical protein